MKLMYECDVCEDIEYIDEEEFKEGMHCECGGHLFLRQFDHYHKKHGIVKCITCQNINSVECKTCVFNIGATTNEF